MTWRRYRSAALLAMAIVSIGCGSGTTAPTSTTRTSAVTESWTGIIAPGGTASRSFTASQFGTLTATLTTADAGTYCVQLFDVGDVAKQATFSVQIVYP